MIVLPREEGRREGIGQLDFTINFSPRFAQLARWSREGTDANRNLEKRFDLDQSSLSLCPSEKHVNYLSRSWRIRRIFFRLTGDLYIVVDSLIIGADGGGKFTMLFNDVESPPTPTTHSYASRNARQSSSRVPARDRRRVCQPSSFPTCSEFSCSRVRWHGARVL